MRSPLAFVSELDDLPSSLHLGGQWSRRDIKEAFFRNLLIPIIFQSLFSLPRNLVSLLLNKRPKMQAFLTSLSILSLALGSVSAAPTSSGKINCQTTPYRTSTISATLQTGYSSNTTTYYGLENVEATNHNGVKSKVLISTKDDGSAFTAEDATKFNFYLCESTYLDTHFDGKWGIVKPVDNEANCIQTKTGSIEQEGVMVSAPCSYEEDSSQLQQSFQHNGHSITFTSHRIGLGQHQHPTHFTRSEVNHHAMKLVPGQGQSQFYNGSKDFAFLNFPDPSKDDA